MKAFIDDRRRIRHIAILCAALSTSPVWAANSALQDLFFRACTSPGGALAARCAQTDDAAGNLSGDSETSLNPTQILSSPQAAMRQTASRAEDARDRSERLRHQAADENLVRRWSVLANLRAIDEERDRTPDANGERERSYERSGGVAELGFDYRLAPNLVAGSLLAYERFDLDFESVPPGNNFQPQPNSGFVDSDRVSLTVFAAHTFGDAGYVDLSAGYTWSDLDVGRRAIFQESNRIVPQTLSVTDASTDGNERWVSVSAGWGVVHGAWTSSVFGGAHWARAEIDGFTESDRTGAGLAMAFATTAQTSANVLLGLRTQRVVNTRVGVLLPQLSATYVHAIEDKAADTATGYLLDANQNRLRIVGDDLDDGYVELSAALSTVFPGGWSAYLDVGYTAGYEDLDRLQLSIGLRKEM